MNRWYLIALICFSACKTGVKAQQYAGLSIGTPTQGYERHQVLFLSAIHFW